MRARAVKVGRSIPLVASELSALPLIPPEAESEAEKAM